MSLTSPIEWDDLASGNEIEIAVDTEFQDVETLSIQFAARLHGQIRVQIYHAGTIPPPPQNTFGPKFGRRFKGEKVTVNPAKPITQLLSPARLLSHLFGLPDALFVDRISGSTRFQDWRSQASPANQKKQILVKLIGHCLRVDLLRAFGELFWKSILVVDPERHDGLSIRDSRVIGVKGTGAEQYKPPILEYVETQDQMYPLVLKTFDTNVAYGSGSLDDLAASYLSMHKDRRVQTPDKTRMKKLFRKNPRTAFQYAVTDVVLTLCLEEKMAELHQQICRELGFDGDRIPPFQTTPGKRVSRILQHDVGRLCSEFSSPISLSRIQRQFEGGTSGCLGDRSVSRFGIQTGQTHGGLLFSRTPTVLFHESDHAFRDLDLSSCYPAILQQMNLYVGRPVIWEPGDERKTLKEVVPFLEKHSAGWDSWFIKVSGEISSAPNALIPSTDDALTNKNYKSRTARARAGKASPKGHSSLYTREISAGVVVWATWKMIQTFPPQLREEYENLRVETVAFYPSKFVADSWEALDQLRIDLSRETETDWRQSLDLDAMHKVTTEFLDEKYAILRYPIKRLAAKLVELRQKARIENKGAGIDAALKLTANTLYGAICSPHLETQNIVAAQVITGTARSIAFAMAQSLNSHNVITDGVIFRVDQIPNGTFADMLNHARDYPIRRVSENIPFLHASQVPSDDAKFTAWYREHVTHFFGVSGQRDYQFLFHMHSLSFKRFEDATIAFDGLVIDGAANYIKIQRQPNEWNIVDFKARSFRGPGKKRLGKWLVEVCSQDQYHQPPEPVESIRLLHWKEAISCSQKALTNSSRSVIPLGMARPTLQTYKILKLSQFLFQTANQKKRIKVEWDSFQAGTQSGLELLATRSSFKGSLQATASAIFELIGRGKVRLRSLNTHRMHRQSLDSPGSYASEVHHRRVRLNNRFLKSLAIEDKAPRTGMTVTPSEIQCIKVYQNDE